MADIAEKHKIKGHEQVPRGMLPTLIPDTIKELQRTATWVYQQYKDVATMGVTWFAGPQDLSGVVEAITGVNPTAIKPEDKGLLEDF